MKNTLPWTYEEYWEMDINEYLYLIKNNSGNIIIYYLTKSKAKFITENVNKGSYMEKLSAKDLILKLQNKLILKLNENEIACPDCKGLRFILIEKQNKGYIENCQSCYFGKVHRCKYCGSENKLYCNCKQSIEEKNSIYNNKQNEIELELYEKAEKINFKDYNGKFIISEYIKEKEDIEDWIKEKLKNDENIPDYLWATEPEKVFSIDLKETISENCEDGYNDMYKHLNINSPLLTQAQELINKWQEEQGESLNIYNIDYKKAIIISDLIEEIYFTLNNVI